MATGVLSLVRVSPERLAAFTAAGYTVLETAKYPSRLDALRDAGDASNNVKAVLTNGRGGISAAEMDMLPQLELVCAAGAGYESVDLARAKSRGIAVANTPDMNAPAVADSAIMLLLASVRHLCEADRFVRAGGWQDQWRVETPTVCGKRLGIFGLGKIGKRIAHRAAHGFDMEIGYHNRHAAAASPYRYFDSLIELAKWADFLIASAPGGPGTRHLINADVLTALGPKGHLINVGRGTVVDTAALIDALQARRIAGAALDVIEGEPAIPPPLLQFDNVVITPHCGGRAPESQTAATAAILANFNAFFSGKPLLSPVSL
jgi:lactate dehydrogenase-like 2-hydroxyacid dehydrogenase